MRGSFSGRSTSSRKSGTRPTCTRHTCAVISRRSDRHGDCRAPRPRRPLTSAAGSRSAVGVHPVLVLPAAGIDALAEVALAVHQADRHQRQRAVRRLLDEVARERAEAAGVDRQRAVDAVLGAEERDRPCRVQSVRRPVHARAPRARCASAVGRPLEQVAVVGRAASSVGRRNLRPAAAPGCSGTAPTARDRASGTARRRRAASSSGSCRRAARAGRARREAGSRALPRRGRRRASRRSRRQYYPRRPRSGGSPSRRHGVSAADAKATAAWACSPSATRSPTAAESSSGGWRSSPGRTGWRAASGLPFTGCAVDGARVGDVAARADPRLRATQTAKPGRALRPRLPLHRRERRAGTGLGCGGVRARTSHERWPSSPRAATARSR